MIDILYVSLFVVFFAAAIAYVGFCTILEEDGK